MRHLPKAEASVIWDEFLAKTQTEAFKCEVLQDYSVIDKSPSLDAWLAGDKAKSIEITKTTPPNPWQTNYGAKAFRKIRLHMVEEPRTPYIEWEVELYRRLMIPIMHEDVRLVPKSKVADLNIPDGDFWIFDDTYVVKYYYNEAGVYAGDVYDETDDISALLTVKEQLLKLAEPLTAI